jgi:cytidylate kinase
MAKSNDLIDAYLKYQLRALEAASRRKRCLTNPFVTIARQAGAGGITIGEKLTEFLRKNDKDSGSSWAIFDKNLIAKVLEEHNLPKRFAELMPEDTVPEVEEFIEELYNLRPSEEALLHKTTETISHLARLGNCVLVGRGANVITRQLPYGLHIRLIGSYEKRMPHIAEYYHFNRTRAIEFVKNEDEGRKKYLKKYFHKNVDDPLLYDLVINTDSVSYEHAALTIGEEVLRMRSQIKGS